VTKLRSTGFALEFTSNAVLTAKTPFVLHSEPADATLEFWLRVPGTDNGTMFWSSPEPKDVNRFNIHLGGGSLGCDYRAPNGDRHALLEAGPMGKFKIAPNQWTHVAITRQVNAYRFYSNGNLVHSATDGKPDLPATSAWTIGGRPSSRFTGLVDEIRFSSKALLPPEFLNASSQKKP
jgi:hypothetical protein